MRITIDQKFWVKLRLVEATGCWEWGPCRNRSGYGWLNNKWAASQLAHRTAWELINGGIPEGLCVLHRCDNPPCCNPDHLFLGTRHDNAKDCIKKGRWPLGSSRYNAKLTENDAHEVRQSFQKGVETPVALAKRFKVSSAAISAVLRRKSWKHVS